MRLHLTGHDVDLDKAARKHVERRIRFALGRFANRIQRVRVACRDVNGPRGGIDKQCRISVTIPNRPSIVVTDMAAHLPAAIDRAAGRVGRAVARHLERLRDSTFRAVRRV